MLWAKSCLYRLEQLPRQPGWDQPQTSPETGWLKPVQPHHTAQHMPVQGTRIYALLLTRARVSLPQPIPVLGNSGAWLAVKPGMAWHGMANLPGQQVVGCILWECPAPSQLCLSSLLCLHAPA